MAIQDVAATGVMDAEVQPVRTVLPEMASAHLPTSVGARSMARPEQMAVQEAAVAVAVPAAVKTAHQLGFAATAARVEAAVAAVAAAAAVRLAQVVEVVVLPLASY